MSDLGMLLKTLRGKMSLREASKKTGISHNYLSIIERGVDPRSGAPVNPTPDSLKKLADAYNYSYEELMKIAGYIEENKKESEYTLSEDEFANIVKEIEEEYKIDLHGNPIAHEAVRQSLDIIARTLKSKE